MSYWKGLRLEQAPLQRLEPRFSCSIDRRSEPVRVGLGKSMDMEGEWEVQFGVVNDASADEVKVVIELSSWHDVSGSFGPYPGVGPEIQEYTDVSGRYPRYITPAYPSSSGCDRG